jgi:hypothetical protein
VWGYVHQLFSYLLSSFNILQAQSHKNPLHIGQEICAHLARSSFPELGLSTKPSYNLHTSFLQSAHKLLTICTQASYNHFHLALQVLTHSMHKASSSTLRHKYSLLLHLAQWPLLTSPSYLFIHYKMGLNMGKTMGRHPIPVT